jgi:hypothetical protein
MLIDPALRRLSASYEVLEDEAIGAAQQRRQLDLRSGEARESKSEGEFVMGRPLVAESPRCEIVAAVAL